MKTSQLLTATDHPESTAKVRSMFDAIAPRYDFTNTVLSLGLHKVWERRLVESLPECRNGRCLDLCTGTGALAPRLAQRYRHVVGVDISPEMLAVARKRWSPIKNIEWLEGDAQRLSFGECEFDAVTVAYGVRNWPDVPAGLAEVYRVLRPECKVAILEFGQPHNMLWKRCFGLYSRWMIPTIGAVLSGNRAPYEYLPRTSAVFPCGQEFVTLLESLGFSQVRHVPLMGGIAYIYVATKSS
jgi:demethylmenaquinone methyltransferase/2-methoxy-6-polyprenyl-1,4-benzoquinol methylase